MLLERLKARQLLSFGPQGIDLPLAGLNVLIGANGSGKSNLLEVLALLRAAPDDLSAPVPERTGAREWLYKGDPAAEAATLEATLVLPDGGKVCHHLELGEKGGRFRVIDESITSAEDAEYRFQQGVPQLKNAAGVLREMKPESLKNDLSILAQVRDPDNYPRLHWLQEQYEQIRLYRNWTFGPSASWRKEQSAHGRNDVLRDGGENLALVLSKIRPKIKNELLASLRKLFEGIENFHLAVDGGNVQLFLEEEKGREIAASRLSDGTLRYLALLTILLHPEPPPLVAIEEPELGLHPDILPHIADLMVEASQRMQLVITTHSRQLVDALGQNPSSIVVCSRQDGESTFERLDAGALREWLKKYSLGDLWSMGELGGNRW